MPKEWGTGVGAAIFVLYNFLIKEKVILLLNKLSLIQMTIEGKVGNLAKILTKWQIWQPVRGSSQVEPRFEVSLDSTNMEIWLNQAEIFWLDQSEAWDWLDRLYIKFFKGSNWFDLKWINNETGLTDALNYNM